MVIFQVRLAALQRTLDRAAQVGQLDRLGEIIHRPALHAEGGAGGVVDGGEHQNGEVGLDFEGLGDEVHAAGSRHADIREHQRHLVQTQLLQRFVR